MNKIKKIYFLLLSINLGFYHGIHSMQQAVASAAHAAVTEEVANAVSHYFSAPENALQQSYPSSQVDIREIMNNPVFQQNVRDGVQEEIEDARSKSPNSDSSASDYSSMPTGDGVPLSEIIEKVKNSKLAQWLGFSKPEALSAVDETYTPQQQEQLRTALTGRLQQENLSIINDDLWQEITTNYPELIQNLLDGFYGKTKLEELETNIEKLKEIIIDIQQSMPSALVPKTFPSPLMFTQHPQHKKFWSSASAYAHSQPTANPSPKQLNSQSQKRLASETPARPKRKPTQAKESISAQELTAQEQIDKDMQKLLKDEEALKALIKQVAFIEKQKEFIISQENIQRSKTQKEVAQFHEKFAKDLQTSQEEALTTEQLRKQEELKKDISQKYKDLKKELTSDLQNISKAMQKSEKDALIKQHQRELLAKKQKEEEEQKALEKKLSDQHKKQRTSLKKREQAEKQKLEQEKAELQERKEKIKQIKEHEQELEKKTTRENLSRKEQKALEKKQKKSDKEIAREQKQAIQKRESDQIREMQEEQDARIKKIQEEEILYDQIAQELQRSTQNLIAKQERSQLEGSELEHREHAGSLFDESLQKLAQDLETLKQSSLKKQHVREQQELDIQTTQEHDTLAKELESMMQKLQDDIKQKQTEQEALDQIDHLKKEEQELYKQLREVEQETQAKIRTQQQYEKSTADLFEQLPQESYQPTAAEQQEYDKTIAQHNADIAQKIGQKRDEVKLQQTALKELQARDAFMQQVEETLKAFQQQMKTQEQRIAQQKQQRSDTEKSEFSGREEINSELDQSLQKLAQDLEIFKQDALAKQHVREQQDLDIQTTQEHDTLAKELESMMQKLQDDIKQKQTEQEALDQIDRLKKEEQELYKQLREVEQETQAKIRTQQQYEKSTADLFEQLPQESYQPTAAEQQEYDKTIAQHNADIAQKIGQKRDEIKLQQTALKELQARDAFMQQVEETLKAFQQQMKTQEQRIAQQKQQRSDTEKSEFSGREEINSELDQSLQKLAQDLETLKQDALAKQHVREQQELDLKKQEDLKLQKEKAKKQRELQEKLKKEQVNYKKEQKKLEEKIALEKEQELNAQREQEVLKQKQEKFNQKELQKQKKLDKKIAREQKQAEQEALDQIDRLKKEEQELYKQLREVEQEAQAKIRAQQQERSTADLFEQLPQESYQPTLAEQQGYDKAIAQHKADIAQKIGQKRDEIERQQAAQKELQKRNALERDLEKQLEKDLEQFAKQMNASAKEAIAKEQLREEQNIADLFSNLPESDIITSAKFTPSPAPSGAFKASAPKFTPKTAQPAPAKTPSSYAKAPFSDENAEGLKNMFEQNQPQPAPKAAQPAPAKAPSPAPAKTPSSYAKAPFSDENAEAVKNMFKQNQPQPAPKAAQKNSNNKKFKKSHKQAPQPKPTPPQQDKKQNDSNMPNMKASGKHAPEKEPKKNSDDDSNHDLGKDKDHKAEMPDQAKEEPKTTEETTPPHKSFKKTPNKKLSLKKATVQKQPLADKKTASNLIPIRIPEKQSTLRTSSHKPTPPAQNKTAHPSDFDYDMPYDMPAEELIAQAPISDYTNPSYPELEKINSAPESSSLTYLKPQSSISNRSKQLNPTETKTYTFKTQEDTSNQKEIITEKNNFSEINTNNQQAQPSDKRHYFQGMWDNVLTTVNSIYLTLKIVFTSLQII